MRIGMMVDLYKPHISGVTNHVELHKKAFDRLGHEVFIFTFGDEKYQHTEENIICTPGLPYKETGLYLNLTYNKKARQLLYTMDLVHVHHPFLSGTLALRYCRPRGIPIVFTNHTRYDLYAHAYLPMLPESIGEAALKAYLPPFCKACDLVISPSKGMADVLHRFGVDSEITIIPNGVELEHFFISQTAIDRDVLGIPEHAVVLVYVGRVAAEKNISFLLRAFNGIAEAYPNIHLLIVGSGPELENIKYQTRNLSQNQRIHLTGFVPYDEIPRYLAACNAFVTSSVSEVHPLSVIEAMASGLPVLGIQSPGIEDTIEDNVSGFLATNDLAAFTAKMARLVTEHENREQMGRKAQEISKKYDIHLTSETLLTYYERSISQSSNRRRGLRYRIGRALDHLR